DPLFHLDGVDLWRPLVQRPEVLVGADVRLGARIESFGAYGRLGGVLHRIQWNSAPRTARVARLAEGAEEEGRTKRRCRARYRQPKPHARPVLLLGAHRRVRPGRSQKLPD